MVIYANVVIRTVVKAVRKTLNSISESGGIEAVNNRDCLITLQDLFDLMRIDA